MTLEEIKKEAATIVDENQLGAIGKHTANRLIDSAFQAGQLSGFDMAVKEVQWFGRPDPIKAKTVTDIRTNLVTKREELTKQE